MDGMPVSTLATRKKQMVQDLNGYIAKKKAITEQAENVASLTGGKKGASTLTGQDGKALSLSTSMLSKS